MNAGSRWESASKQKIRASALIQSKPICARDFFNSLLAAAIGSWLAGGFKVRLKHNNA
jgi:hypothetical protein